MKDQFGELPEDEGHENDNFRAKRYVSKYTINPAIAHGIADYVGSIEVGKEADLVIWKPALFGVKPEIIMKSGFVVASKMGDPNGSIPTPQPVIYREMWGAMGTAASKCSITFVSQISVDNGTVESYGLKRKFLPVKGCRNIGKKDMVNNDKTPDIRVDPETYRVYVDGEYITSEPVDTVPLAQRYFLF